jgi:protein SCO1/2
MKKNLILISALLGLMVLTGAYLIIASETDQEKRSNKAMAKNAEENKSCCSSEVDSEKSSDNSIFLLEGNWKSESNKNVNWSSLKGTNYVMTMIFTNCTYACPVIVNDMKKVEAQLSNKELKKVKFLLVSMDPERDTPEALLKFAKQYDIDLNRWQLLTSNESNVSEVAAVLGLKYKKETDGSYSHSNIITVLNKDGEINFQHFGLNQNIDDVVGAIKKLN